MEAPQVVVDTSMGSFTVELYYKHAPKACKNFVELSKKGYYDGTIVSCNEDGDLKVSACSARYRI